MEENQIVHSDSSQILQIWSARGLERLDVPTRELCTPEDDLHNRTS